MSTYEPFATAQQAARASRWERIGRGASISSANRSQLRDELAGVDLGAFDKQILDWLAGYEPSTVTVICGWLARSRAKGATDCAMLTDAIVPAPRRGTPPGAQP